MTEPILRLDSLDKRFGDAVAARDFSLDVHAGEFFTFLGPSGRQPDLSEPTLRWYVELPLVRPGILGASTFSIILSFNETVRTGLVQGPLNTVQTYIWSRYLQVGLTPSIYALMSLMILITLLFIAAMLLFSLRTRKRLEDR